MHWVLMCLERVARKAELSQAASWFKSKFGTALPRSVQYKIENLLFPRAPMRIVRGAKPPGETNAEVAARLGITKRQVAKMRAKGEIS